ncbi:hypothetical protein [Brevibacillus sp. BC25]|uniref:hypothetical protein n=1 Tax=Brevibacillus sp. BC25 TaxID=1144308 RepID=UPI000270F444|nr:hypothetical protein [Brevibacillus sp. BC25]EJL31549.1 hypothetical protein PMI05_00674 [Brevibacillus sp. BC25]
MFKKMVMSTILFSLIGICIFIWFYLYQEVAGTKNNSNFSKQFLTMIEEDDDEDFSGTLTFSSDFKPEYLAEKGFTFINQQQRQGIFGPYMANVFGARDAEIKVMDATGKIIGLFQSDENGNFDFETELSNFYELEITFDGRRVELTLPKGKNEDLSIYITHGLSEKYLPTVEESFQNASEALKQETNKQDSNFNTNSSSEAVEGDIKEFIVLQNGSSVDAFYTANEAIEFAKNLDQAEVVNPNVGIWDNKPSSVYQYDKHLKDFSTKKEAIEFANKYDHAKVVNLKTGKVEFDNYPKECGTCESPIQNEY